MVTKLAVLAALTCAMAFGQSKIPAAGNTGSTAGATRSSAESDTGSTNNMQMKSIDQVLQDSPRLSANLKAMLPADVTPQQACSGFKTLEQCVVTIHTSQNLNLNFADLKAKITGKHSISLEKSVEQMAAQANAKEEVKKAKKQASEDMKGVSLFG